MSLSPVRNRCARNLRDSIRFESVRERTRFFRLLTLGTSLALCWGIACAATPENEPGEKIVRELLTKAKLEKTQLTRIAAAQDLAAFKDVPSPSSVVGRFL